MRHLHILFFVALLSPPAWSDSLAGGYNVFISNNFTVSNNGDSTVPMAIGGNATLSNYSLDSSSNPNVTGGWGTVVGGKLTLTNGSVSPHTYSGQTPSLTSVSPCSGCVTSGGTSPVNFGALETQLLSESSYLAGLSSAGNTVAIQNSGLTFTANTAQPNAPYYVFSLSASQLTQGFTYYNFLNVGSSTVIVNVTGTSNNQIVNGGWQGANDSKVLFNFENSSALTVSSFNASILAPYATVTGNAGNFDGTLIAQNFQAGSGAADEFHSNYAFSGTVPTPSVVVASNAPEPSTLVLLGGVLLAAGLFRIRQRN